MGKNMTGRNHKIYDIILKIIITSYLSEFLAYIGVKKTINRMLKTEITTLSGRTVHLDFLCKADDGKLYNIEFQLKGPYHDDLERIFDYNIIARVRHDTTAETVIVNFRTKKSGKKQINICESIDFHPQFCHLGENDYEKILNNIENKVKNNFRLNSFEKISLLIMALLPKYKNKTIMLKRICKVLENRNCFNTQKIEIIESVIQLEIKNFIPEIDKKEFKKEIEMTPETQAIFEKAIEETNKKWHQIELDKAKKEGIKEGKEKGIKEGKEKGREEGIREIVKNLQKTLTDAEIAKHTGLSIEKIKSL